MIADRAAFCAGLFDAENRAAYVFNRLVAYPVRLTLASFLMVASQVPTVFFVGGGLDIPPLEIAIFNPLKTSTKNT